MDYAKENNIWDGLRYAYKMSVVLSDAYCYYRAAVSVDK